MQILLYTCNDDKRKLEKELSHGEIRTGNIRNEFNILTPVFTITDEIILERNYVFIPSFNRYYYISDIRVVRTNLFEVSLKCDVLMSHKDEIKKCTGKASTSEQTSPYFADFKRGLDVRKDVEKYPFENNFNADGQIVLVTMANTTT